MALRLSIVKEDISFKDAISVGKIVIIYFSLSSE